MAKTKTKKLSTRSVKRNSSVAKPITQAGPISKEMDSVYILKLVLYMILGAQWIRITRGDFTVPLPIGAFIGFMFARSERFQIDRKLEFAILLMAMFIGFWVLPGIELLL